MYAVILTGGKQYKVKPGDVINIDKLELGIGNTVDFGEVLMLIDGEKSEIGTPYLSGKAVKGEVVAQMRSKKVRIIKFRRRKHSMKRQGHRQYLTAVRITEVAGNKVASKGFVAKKKQSKPAAEKPASVNKVAVTEKKSPVKKAAAQKEPVAKSATQKPSANKTTVAKKPAARKPAAKKTESK